jgi:hypothetical protein
MARLLSAIAIRPARRFIVVLPSFRARVAGLSFGMESEESP